VVFKAWQIFVFSLIPLALVFTGVIIGSMRGVGQTAEEFPASGSGGGVITPGAAPTVAPGATLIEVAAKDLQFAPRTLRARPNTQITVRLNNQDAGVQHNIAFYPSRTATTEPLVSGARGALFQGPGIQDTSFTTPGPGSYFFRCDVHPDMTGTFTVQ
jgi:plastocyanin